MYITHCLLPPTLDNVTLLTPNFPLNGMPHIQDSGDFLQPLDHAAPLAPEVQSVKLQVRGLTQLTVFTSGQQEETAAKPRPAGDRARGTRVCLDTVHSVSDANISNSIPSLPPLILCFKLTFLTYSELENLLLFHILIL